MTFIPDNRRIVPPHGSDSAKICIIGEAPGAEEERVLKPFVGMAGSVLEQCLHAAGISRAECYFTNVVKVRPKDNDISPYFNTRTGAFTPAGQQWVEVLWDELASVSSNILVPLGATALAATTGHRSILKLRGYVMEGLPAINQRKCIPTIHPSAALRGQYIYRYYITGDLRKVRAESEYPEIRRPERRIVVPQTLSEVMEWVDYLNDCPSLAVDIEVKNFHVSCIGFAPTPQLAVSVPINCGWSETDEAMIWKALAMLLENPAIVKVFQNGTFDVHFLAMRCGIHVQGRIEDTMIAHHIMYPEMLKGLEFLVSVYCGAQAHYKDMVRWDNIKKES